MTRPSKRTTPPLRPRVKRHQRGVVIEQSHRFRERIGGQMVHFYAGQIRSGGRVGWGYQYKEGSAGSWEAMKPLHTDIVPIDSARSMIRAGVLRDYRARYGRITL
jgi:hypothetical protein